jgi:hypothetical protein
VNSVRRLLAFVKKQGRRAMTDMAVDVKLGRTAKVAGGMFLLSLLVPMLNWTLINAKFIAPGNAVETVRRVLANEGLFRVGLVNDLLTSAIALVLALTLYLLLKTVNKPWAQLALGLKATEGMLMAVIALGNFAVLLVINQPAFLTAADLAQARGLAGMFLNTRMTLAAVPMLFLGLDFTVFLSLLYKSKYVPGMLAGFGVFSYALILIYALLTLLLPNVAAILAVQTACWAPSCLFELVMGTWLLTKGITLQPENKPE